MGVIRKAGAYEYVHHIVHVSFSLGQAQAGTLRECTSDIGMAAIVVVRSIEQVIGIRVSVRTNDIMHARSSRIRSIPLERV